VDPRRVHFLPSSPAKSSGAKSTRLHAPPSASSRALTGWCSWYGFGLGVYYYFELLGGCRKICDEASQEGGQLVGSECQQAWAAGSRLPVAGILNRASGGVPEGLPDKKSVPAV